MKRGRYLRGAVRRARAGASRARAAWGRARGALSFRRKRTAELLRTYKATKGLPALQRYRTSRALAAKSRVTTLKSRKRLIRAAKRRERWERALARFRELRRNPYPHLSGDLDCDARVLEKLERLARRIGRNIYVTSGGRTYAEQAALYARRFSNPYPVAPPGTSAHERLDSADCLIGGVPIQNVVSGSLLRQYGLTPLVGDAVHVTG